MGLNEVFSGGSAGVAPGHRTCEACGEAFGPQPGLGPALLGGTELKRCRRCGRRSDPASGRLLSSCAVCRLPFLAAEAEERCDTCREQPASPPEGREIDATEAELIAALEDQWSLVARKDAGRYLDALCGQLATVLDGAPRGVKVVVVDEDRCRVLALPSGTILVSLGLLRFIEDEAELVFVLARQMVHLAGGTTGERLIRFGFASLARPEAEPDPRAWIEAAADMMALGYGDPAEEEADRRAIEAMSALGYDPQAACNHLSRLGEAVSQGLPEFAELTLASPPAERRMRAAEGYLSRSAQPRPGRINREPFRRAVGEGSPADGWEPTTLAVAEAPAAGGNRLRWLGWLAALGALTGLGFVLLRLLG